MLKETIDTSYIGSNEYSAADVRLTCLFNDKTKIFIAGDSIACDYNHISNANRFPRTGWGQVIKYCFNDKIQVVNCALGGRSSKSFLHEENFRFIFENIRRGDYLFISFGRNDCKAEDPVRYTSVYDGSFQKCLLKYIFEARSRHAYPVLITPAAAGVDDDSIIEPYANAVRSLARTHSVALAELNGKMNEYKIKNPTEFFGWFMNIKPNDKRFAGYPYFKLSQYFADGCRDNIHLNIFGAKAAAAFIAEELKTLQGDINKYFK